MNLDAASTRSYPRGDYEEYHPYGSTAWWAGSSSTVSQKRYRFTGMERDDETGLQCHGVRYYAVWLGRWVSADPIGLGDGVNRYQYAAGSPLNRHDETGTQSNEPDEFVTSDPEDPLSYATFAEYRAAAQGPHSDEGLRANWEQAHGLSESERSIQATANRQAVRRLGTLHRVAPLDEPHLPVAEWEDISVSGRKVFALRPDVPPSLAIDEVVSPRDAAPVRLDCRMGADVARVWGLRQALGSARFDELIGTGRLVLPLSADPDQVLSQLQIVGDNTTFAKPPWRDGDSAYFRNDPRFSWHTRGTSLQAAQGEWTLFDAEKQAFVGFAVGTHTAPDMLRLLEGSARKAGLSPPFVTDFGWRARWDLTQLEEREAALR